MGPREIKSIKKKKKHQKGRFFFTKKNMMQASSYQLKSNKEYPLDLAKLLNKHVRVKMTGGRELQGALKGFDQLMNLVIDETEEHSENIKMQKTSNKKTLGLVVAKGASIIIVAPTCHWHEITNPFINTDDSKNTE